MKIFVCLFFFSSLFFFGPAKAQRIAKLNIATENVFATLLKDFKQAKPPTSKIYNKKWVCEFYGARSRARRPRPSHLYEFKGTNGVNFGSQLVKVYRPNKQLGWVGKRSIYTDVIRMTKGNQLIAELSVPQKTVSAPLQPSLVIAQHEAIAYARCSSKAIN